MTRFNQFYNFKVKKQKEVGAFLCEFINLCKVQQSGREIPFLGYRTFDNMF